MSDLSDPGVIAKKISAALSGTFLGIFSAYALFGPLGVLIKHNNSAAALGLDIIRVLIASFAKGLAPFMAVDVSRRALPSNIQPSGDELEELINRSNSHNSSSQVSKLPSFNCSLMKRSSRLKSGSMLVAHGRSHMATLLLV